MEAVTVADGTAVDTGEGRAVEKEVVVVAERVDTTG
jgi:hypothetical protein